MKIILGAVLLAAVVAFSAIINGYALSVLWGWFISPYFELKELSIPIAIGLALVVGYMTHQEGSTNNDSFLDVLAKALVRTTVKTSVSLSFGWVVTLFI